MFLITPSFLESLPSRHIQDYSILIRFCYLETQGTDLSFQLTGNVESVSSLVVHQYGVMSFCNTTGSAWNPIDAYSDITARIGTLFEFVLY